MTAVLPPMRLSPPLVAVWFILSITLGAVGPFGTYDLQALPHRLLYWTGIVTFCLALEFVNQRNFPVATFGGRVFRRLVYVLIVSLVLNAVNSLLFDTWAGNSNFFKAFGYVAGVAVFIEAVIAVAGIGDQTTLHEWDLPERRGEFDSAGVPAVQTLLDRLAPETRGALQHLEAQGHYLRVVTDAGSETILMRFKDAVAGLPAELGVQIHRSHWISYAATDCLQTHSSKLYARLYCGKLVPVSRARTDAVRAIFEACRAGS